MVLTEGRFRQMQAHRQILTRIEFAIVVIVEALRFHPEVFQQAHRLRRVLRGRVDGLTAAVPDQHLAIDGELVAARMSAKVIVIIQNQNAGIRLRLLVVARRREPGEATADHHQIVGLIHRCWGDAIAFPAPGHRVHDVEGPVV